MGSFYGNIKNSNRVGLIFDKIYPNRAAMEESCSTDGIFNNRFVLIDYGQVKVFPYTRVFPTKEQFQAGIENEKYYTLQLASSVSDFADKGYIPETVRILTNDDINKIYDNNGSIKADAPFIFIKRDSLLDSRSAGINNSNDANEWPISEFVQNKEIDLAKYNDSFQHTVWQKIWTQTGSAQTVVEKYIKVADLDAAAPILNMVIDAPSDNDSEGFILYPSSADGIEDGYMSAEDYDGYKFNLFYFEDGAYTSIYKSTDKTSGDIYYRNELNEYTTIASSEGQQGYEKAAYDENRQYWIISSIGAGPHFDPLKSTDLEYVFHMPRPWKIAKEVNFEYNEDGFLPYSRQFIEYAPNSASFDVIEDSDRLTTLYPTHMDGLPEAAEYDEVQTQVSEFNTHTKIKMSKQPDTKQLGIKILSIGKMISDVWDIIYPCGIMTEVKNEDKPQSEYDSNYNNLLYTENGLAKYFYSDNWMDGRITEQKFKDSQKDLLIKKGEEYVSPSTYDQHAFYYTYDENGKEVLVKSNIEVFYPATKDDLTKVLYTFTEDPNGDVRVMHIGNDRVISADKNYPNNIGTAIRTALALLGLPKDNVIINHPPRETVYGLLNGAKTLLGNPNDTLDEVSYILVPEDGYISEEFFNYLKNSQDLKLYYNNPVNPEEKIEATTYEATVQYYYNISSLWAYLKDFKDMRNECKVDWNESNSEKLSYIANRPMVIDETEILKRWNAALDGEE